MASWMDRAARDGCSAGRVISGSDEPLGDRTCADGPRPHPPALAPSASDGGRGLVQHRRSTSVSERLPPLPLIRDLPSSSAGVLSSAGPTAGRPARHPGPSYRLISWSAYTSPRISNSGCGRRWRRDTGRAAPRSIRRALACGGAIRCGDSHQFKVLVALMLAKRGLSKSDLQSQLWGTTCARRQAARGHVRRCARSSGTSTKRHFSDFQAGATGSQTAA